MKSVKVLYITDMFCRFRKSRSVVVATNDWNVGPFPTRHTSLWFSEVPTGLVPVLIQTDFRYCWTWSHPEYQWNICCWMLINNNRIVVVTWQDLSLLSHQGIHYCCFLWPLIVISWITSLLYEVYIYGCIINSIQFSSQDVSLFVSWNSLFRHIMWYIIVFVLV